MYTEQTDGDDEAMDKFKCRKLTEGFSSKMSIYEKEENENYPIFNKAKGVTNQKKERQTEPEKMKKYIFQSEKKLNLNKKNDVKMVTSKTLQSGKSSIHKISSKQLFNRPKTSINNQILHRASNFSLKTQKFTNSNNNKQKRNNTLLSE